MVTEPTAEVSHYTTTSHRLEIVARVSRFSGLGMVEWNTGIQDYFMI